MRISRKFTGMMRFSLLMKTGWLPAMMLSLVSLPLRAQPSTPQLTDSEILDIVSGRTTFGTFSDRPINYAVHLTEDGQMIARISEGAEETIELGQWRVANDLLRRWWL